MSADTATQLDPATLAGFAARGVEGAATRDLVGRARRTLSAEELRTAIETVSQTRLLSWPECVRFAQLQQPLGDGT